MVSVPEILKIWPASDRWSPVIGPTAFLIDLVKQDSNKNDTLCRNLIAQILFARHFDLLLELRALDLRVEFVERIQRRFDVNLINFVEEVLDAVVLGVMNLVELDVRLRLGRN